MMVDTGRDSDSFDQLKGNKDFRPVFKLLQARDRLLAAFDQVNNPRRPALSALKQRWEDCGRVLHAFIDLVWMQGCTSYDARWTGTGLAREFVWRFYKVAPVER